jgi:DNA-binding PadR family transcriptional regulator
MVTRSKDDGKDNGKMAAPLSAAALHILLALAGEDRHGYGIIQEVARYSEGRYRVGPGTLYDNLKKLMDAGWVADVERAEGEEDARRMYTLTMAGREVLAAEVERMADVVTEARLRLGRRRTV